MAPLPWSRTARATWASGPSRSDAALIIIGRLTPVTISTLADRYGRLRLVGVPPNMSVSTSTSPPASTTARPIALLAVAASSPQPSDTATTPGSSPWIVRAAVTSSSASRPCVTTTIAIIGSLLPGVAVLDAHREALAAHGGADRVGQHHRAVAAARAADREREVAAALPLVARQHERDEREHAPQEGPGLRP